MSADDRRARIIQGVRDLADWLEANPDVPVHAVEARYSVGATVDDDGVGRTELERIAAATGTGVLGNAEYHGQAAGPDETHFYAARSFANAGPYDRSGDVYYRATYILRQHIADTDEADKARADVIERLRAARKGGAS